MALATVSDAEFIRLFERLRSPTAVARYLGINQRAVFARRNRIEQRHSIPLQSHNQEVKKENFRSILPNINGHVLVFSDAHLWPGDNSPAYRALLLLIKKLSPTLKAIICNGDLFDGANISRFGRSGVFENTPHMVDELEYAQAIMSEIEKTAPKHCNLIFTAGNHDIRFTKSIAQSLPEFCSLGGFQFQDYFKKWSWCWSCVINPDTIGETWIKHRWHQGALTAAQNNVIKGCGVHFVTAHTHALEVKPYVAANGKRYYGVQTGTLSPIGNETMKFSYGEDSPTQSTQGFALLTYEKNTCRLLPPELIETIEGDVYFRGGILLKGRGGVHGKKAKRKNRR